MTRQKFESILDALCAQLGSEARRAIFPTSIQFETRARQIVNDLLYQSGYQVDFAPHPQAFPDIAVGPFGIEVKHTTNDTWRSVANSVLETNRIQSVRHVYLLFGKMGGQPDVRWDVYEKCVMHVRTSHVPRFEVEIGASVSLFDQMGISYDQFRISEMHEKMQYIRQYARGRLKPGERLWWLEDTPGEQHSFPIQARLYTKLPPFEKIQLRAEAVLLCPRIVESGRSRDKYDDVVLFLLTYHGVLCHQARDLFSAGSVANPTNDDNGGIYIARALQLLEPAIVQAAYRMDDALFVEYWGVSVPPRYRISEWLRRADCYARDWVPSQVLFLNGT